MSAERHAMNQMDFALAQTTTTLDREGAAAGTTSGF
jgi:hypothetical protein